MKLKAPSQLALIAGLAFVYFSTARLGLTMAFVAEQVTVVWPPSGIAIAAVLLLGYWVLPGIALGAFLANITTAAPISAALGIACGNTLEALTGAWLIHQCVYFHPSLVRIRDSLALVVCGALIGTIVAAVIGVTSLCLTGVEAWSKFGGLLWVWWLGDAVGVLVVAPLILTLSGLREVDWSAVTAKHHEAFAVFTLLIVVCSVVFMDALAIPVSHHPLEYIIFPFVIWAALRFGQLGTSLVTFTASFLAICGTLEGFGPFAGGSTQESLVLLQSYMSFVAVTGLLLSAAISERAIAERRRSADYAVSQRLATAKSLVEAAPGILQSLCESLGWAVGGLWLRDQSKNVLRCASIWHSSFTEIPEFKLISEELTFGPGVGLPGRILSSGEPQWISNVVHDSNFPRGPIASREGLHGAFGFPILVAGEVYGVIEFFSPEIRRPDTDLLAMMSAISRQIEQFVERTRATLELRQNEQQLRLLTDTLPVIIAYIDTERRYVFLNRQYETWVGRKREAVYGKTIREVTGDETYERVRPSIDRAFAGEQVKFESWLPNDPSRCVESTYVPHRDRDGRVVGMYAVTMDITARKRAEDALKESERRFRLMADSAPVLIWLGDEQLSSVWFNRPWLDFVGRPIESEIGDGWQEHVHPDDRGLRKAVFDGASGMRRPFTVEFRMRRKDGVYRWLLVSGIPLDGEGSEFRGYIGSCVDITERREAESRLHDADKRKDEFLATLAHELRNPLAPIRNALQLMSHPGAGTELVNTSRQVIDRQLKQLVRLVDDLLDVSRITRGKVELRREMLDLRSSIDSALETSAPLIESFGHTLSISRPDKPVMLSGDNVRLAQVIANLLNNAAKYTDRQGKIWLELIVENETAVLKVRDNGVGISAEMLPKIFDMFTQFDSKERGHGGLGLGLTLVRTLVELHGGTVSAASDGPRTGTEVTVRLPLGDRPQAVKPKETPPAELKNGGGFRSQRILVVDDNRDSADSLTLILRLFGHEVRTAYDGPTALSEAQKFLPETVLLDIGLPGMSGYEVAKELRADPRFKKSVLVAQTGWGQEHDRKKAKDSGFDHHLVKPVDADKLESLVGSKEVEKGAS